MNLHLEDYIIVLKNGKTYKIRITTGVSDGSGINMGSQYQIGTGFTTSK